MRPTTTTRRRPTMRRLFTLACSTTLLATWFTILPVANAASPGDNGAIVSTRFTEGQIDLWAIDPETSNLMRITDTPRKNESLPDWNADGTRLAYAVCLGEFQNCDIRSEERRVGNE